MTPRDALNLAVLALALWSGPPLAAQTRPAQSVPVSELRYELTLGPDEADAGLIEVQVSFRVNETAPVLLSMAAWTPGSYRMANYARAVSGFAATQNGDALVWDKLDPDTWRIRPRRAGVITLRYRVRTDDLDVAGSWSAPEFAFFNGTNVFLYVEGRPDTPAQVVIHSDSTWRVATGMTPGDSLRHFRALDVDDLLDHPMFVGRFDLDSALVADRWMRLATWPVGSVQGRRRAALWDALTRSVEPLAQVFGEVPWKSYTVLQVVHDEVSGMAALEHSESELALVGTSFVDEPFVIGVHAHELVHAWNVKRLRPTELTPYRYDAAQPTPWLWISEGVTDYYADLALVRSGLLDEPGFLANTLGKIESVAARPATSLEDASFQTWLGMRDGTGDLYYDKGSLAGLALDILIRDASDNSRSLDHVMRELYTDTYKKGRGFTHDDVWNAIARATRGRAFGDFERRYIDGRDAYPWAQWLARGGWRFVEDSISEPRLGLLMRGHPDGVLVTGLDPDGMAARAGVELGDVIVSIGGSSTSDPDFGRQWRAVWGNRGGAALPMLVLRGAERQSLTAHVELDKRVERRIEPDPKASTRARRIRTGILQGLPRP
jgi:predicted metalloprotease with PDZ domain